MRPLRVVEPMLRSSREKRSASRNGYALAFSLLCVIVVVSGCATGAKGQAAALVAAVDRFRRADVASKAAEAAAVAAVTCTDANVCGAKNVCLAAIDPTARALALKNEVALRVADIEARRLAPDSAEAQALPSKLEEAGKLLRQGHEKMGDCERRLAELQMEHGV